MRFTGKPEPRRVSARRALGRGAITWLPVVVAIAVAAGGCGVPTESSPRKIDPTSVPYNLLGASPGPSAPTPTPTPERAAPEVYFVDAQATLDSVPREIKLTSSDEMLRTAITALTSGPTSAEQQAGLSSAIPPGLNPTVSSLAGGQATIDLAGEQVPSGDQSILSVAQLVLTATSVPGVTSVALTRDGQTIEAPLVDGVLVDRPLVAADYRSLIRKPSN
jgi:spore germination protein GerM